MGGAAGAAPACRGVAWRGVPWRGRAVAGRGVGVPGVGVGVAHLRGDELRGDGDGRGDEAVKKGAQPVSDDTHAWDRAAFRGMPGSCHSHSTGDPRPGLGQLSWRRGGEEGEGGEEENTGGAGWVGARGGSDNVSG